MYTNRWMIRRDMEEVLAIEDECFFYPWSESDFSRCLRQRNCIGMVAEQGERIVGFMIYELHTTKLILLNFAVGWQWQRRGVGTAMMRALLGKLSPRNRSSLEVVIREKNLDAQLFFRAMGFRARHVLRDYYDDSPEDAYLFEYRLPVAEGVACS